MHNNIAFLLQDEFGLNEDTYEVCYNSACFLLGKGLYQEAVDKLKEAESKYIVEWWVEWQRPYKYWDCISRAGVFLGIL